MCAANYYQQVGQKDNFFLYQHMPAKAQQSSAGVSWSGFLVSQNDGSPPGCLDFDHAWADYPGTPFGGQNGGCYLFCRTAPTNLDRFLGNLKSLLGQLYAGENLAYRYVMWLLDPDAESAVGMLPQCLPFVSTLDANTGTVVNQQEGPTRYNAISFGNIYLEMEEGVTIAADAGTLQFTNFDGNIGLWNSNGPYNFGVVSRLVALDVASGALTFNATFNTQSVYGNDFIQMEAGLRYFMPDGAGGAVAQSYLLWQQIPSTAEYQMDVALAPLWPEDPERTYFQFGEPAQGTAMPPFPSSLVTPNGNAIWLTPAAGQSRLVMMGAKLQGNTLPRDQTDLLYLAPDGDFVLSNVQGDQPMLMCGLSGTESLSFELDGLAEPGFILNFKSHMPAYAPLFPLKSASSLDAPRAPTAPLLDATLGTSWITLRRLGEQGQSRYTSLPKGFSLYGCDDRIFHADAKFLGSTAPSTSFSASGTCYFPVAPYVCMQPGTWSRNDIQTFEREILSPTRRGAIAQDNGRAHLPANAIFAAGEQVRITTPSGQTVALDREGNWHQILLGQVTQPALTQIAFAEPAKELVQAFQTSDLLLVVANPRFLGTPGETFGNSLNIEQWGLAAQVGANDSYGDYSNIVIVKGRKGKLYSPAQALSQNLVATPDKWTQQGAFAAPNGKVDELLPLAQWLVDYFQQAAARGADPHDPDALYFQEFNDIAADENWTGVLVLRAVISSLPEQMKGILAGVADPAAFYCHHFAVAVSPTEIAPDGPSVQGSSSVYGLIYYEDPNYDGAAPVAPDLGADYDFRLLSLKVLFDNTAVKRFQSYAQVTFNRLFGSTVSAMGEGGNDFNSIILQGSFQENGGMPVYSLSTVKDYTFLFENNVLNKIEIVSTQMQTVSSTAASTEILFTLAGFIDFATLQRGAPGDATEDIDMFSFGSTDGKTPRQGLSFSSLGLRMRFPTAQPDQKTFAFISENIRFDIDASTIRDGSLYRSFGLELVGLDHGGKNATTASHGFLDIITDLRLSGVDGAEWTGLDFRLNLGTPGQLAGKLGLNANLLLAWSAQGGTGQDYKAQAGLRLPGTADGASMFSLQNVLKLSFGAIRLVYVPITMGASERSFMLLLTEIALKFLGLMKIPPNGASTFYLFGNPDSGGKPGGLGWYARYQQDSKSRTLLPSASRQER